MARIFLHIGYPKTGTSSLQWFFTRNAEEFKRRENLLYPETSRTHVAHYGISMCLNIGVYDGQQRTSEAAKEALNKEIDKSGCDTVLISSEAFIAAKSFEPVKEFFSGHELYFVVYLRRHDHALESAYSQSVCQTVDPPWSPGIDSFILYQMSLGTVPWNYLSTLQRLAAAVGKDRVIVRPFEREQNLPDIYADFLAAIGVKDSEAYERPNRNRNPSLHYRTLATIDAIMRSKASRPTKLDYAETIARLRDGSLKEATFLSPGTRDAILAAYRPTYAVIAREFMGRNEGVLFKEQSVIASGQWSPPTMPSIQETAELILSAATAIEQRPPLSLADTGHRLADT